MPQNTLHFFENEFGRVGWFIPPYIAMGALNDAPVRIRDAGDSFDHRDLEAMLASFYEPQSLAAMVLHRYPIVPVICEYAATIREAIEAHFMGLHHVAVAGLVPVIEGAARRLAEQRAITSRHVKDVFRDLADACKADGVGAVGEVASMMDSFKRYARESFFVDSRSYPFGDGTNRHGIAHGAYTDDQYGLRP